MSRTLAEVIDIIETYAELPYGSSGGNLETDIREAIAQELENLVLPGTKGSTQNLGVGPDAFHGLARPTAPEVKQAYMMGAANCVRGNNPVTEEDWETQGVNMRARAIERDMNRDH